MARLVVSNGGSLGPAVRTRPRASRLLAAGLAGALLAAALTIPRLPPAPVTAPAPALPQLPAAPASAHGVSPVGDPSPWAIVYPASFGLAQGAPPGTEPDHPLETPGRVIQVGAFRNPANAEALRADLAGRFDDVTVTPIEHDGLALQRVRLEGLPDAAAVDAALASLRASGLAPIRVLD